MQTLQGVHRLRGINICVLVIVENFNHDSRQFDGSTFCYSDKQSGHPDRGLVFTNRVLRTQIIVVFYNYLNFRVAKLEL